MTKCKRIARKIQDLDNTFFPIVGTEKPEAFFKGSVLHNLDHCDLVMKMTKAGPRMDIDFYTLAPRRNRARGIKESTPSSSTELQRKQLDRNMKHSEKRGKQLIETNFLPGKDYVIAFSVKEELTIEEVKKVINNFFDRVRRQRKRTLKKSDWKLKYIYCINVDEGHRIHVHMIINGGLSPCEIEKIWNKGNICAQRLEAFEGVEGAGKYLFEQNKNVKTRGALKYKRMWIPSRGLKQPEEYWCRPDARMLKLFREEYAIKENAEKYFRSYTFQKHERWESYIHNSTCLSITLRKTNVSLPIQEVVVPVSKHETNTQNKTCSRKVRRKTVKVSRDYVFMLDGVHYSMPSKYKGLLLKVVADEQHLDVYYNDQFVRSWARAPKEEKWQIDPTDIPEGWSNYRYYSWADRIGSATRKYIETLIMRRRYPVEAYRTAQAILIMSKDCDNVVFEASCEKALRRRAFSYKRFANILRECRNQWVEEILKNGHRHDYRVEQINFFNLIDGTSYQ